MPLTVCWRAVPVPSARKKKRRKNAKRLISVKLFEITKTWKELLKKRYENDGGAAARRMLANQKATVKVF